MHTNTDIWSCTYDDFLFLRFQVREIELHRHDYAHDPGGGRDKMYGTLWVFKLTNWQELIAKEAFPSNFVAFTQEMGCQISAFVPFDEPLHCESFFSFALHATSNVGIIFLLFSIIIYKLK